MGYNNRIRAKAYKEITMATIFYKIKPENRKTPKRYKIETDAKFINIHLKKRKKQGAYDIGF